MQNPLIEHPSPLVQTHGRFALVGAPDAVVEVVRHGAALPFLLLAFAFVVWGMR
jgi:hypothetical protein